MVVGMPPAKKAKGKNGKGIPTKVQDGSAIGEVRYDKAQHAKVAIQKLNGKQLKGSVLSIELDPKSQDQTKLLVHGIPRGAEWQELKDHFGQIGPVAFTDVRGGGRKSKSLCGEVRFDDAQVTAQALQMFNGTELMGSNISVNMDKSSKDSTKLLVTGLSDVCGWQDLKDHFAQVGTPVAFCQIRKGGGSGRAEVRYDDASHATLALNMLNGTDLLGHLIKIEIDPASADGSKLNVWNLSPVTTWQDLKDHFGQCGQVAFADMKTGKGKAKGGGAKGGGKTVSGDANMKMMQQMMSTMMSFMKQMGGGKGKW